MSLDILLASPLPLHPHLLDHPRLSIRLIADGEVCEETQAVSVDLETGVWDIHSSCQLPEAAEWLTLAIVVHEDRTSTQFASATYSMKEIISRVEIQLDGYQEFNIGDSCPVQFVMSCLVEKPRSSATDGLPSQVITQGSLSVLRETESWQLSTLGVASFERFERLGNLTDIEDSVLSLRKAVELTADGHPEKSNRLSNLGTALLRRFERLGSIKDIEDSISSLRKAVALTSDSDPRKPIQLKSLGGALMRRFEHLDNIADMEDSISSLQKAIGLTSDGHPQKPSQLTNLGATLMARFERRKDTKDIEDSISCLRKAVALTLDGDPRKSSRLSNLGGTLMRRFERLGNIEDIEDSILSHRKAVALTSDGDPQKPIQLSNLGAALVTRFERRSNITDIEDSISSLRQAVALTSDDHPERPSRLSNLGTALMRRFERLDNITDMEDAILGHQEAVALTSDGDPERPNRLSNLGTALMRRFERLDNITDMEDSISNLRKAVAITSDSEPQKPIQFTNLGAALTVRFERLNNIKDIEDSISSLRKAVALTSDGDSRKPNRLNSLGTALLTRFKCLNNIKDLEDSILSLRQVVELAPEGSLEKSGQLSNLGTALMTRFERLDNITDIEDSISCLRKAVELTSDGHPQKPIKLGNLGTALTSRFERRRSVKDIEDAILSQRKAVELTPDGSPGEPDQLYNLGRAFKIRFKHFHSLEDLESALRFFARGANLTTGPAWSRFNAARLWAETENDNGRPPLAAFSRTIDLLPQIAWLGLAVTDQHALLANVGGVVRDAVASAIQWDELEIAVEWAEQGRSIVWQNMLGLRTPVDELQASHPQLASRLRDVSKRMEASAAPDAEEAARKNLELAVEWENTVEEIRQLAGFNRFLKAKPFSQLAPAAYEGPVVILNVNASRCDALVLIANDSDEKRVSIIDIPLARFSSGACQKLSEKLTGLLESTGVRARGENRQSGRRYPEGSGEARFKNILRILWLDVVKPVIDALAYQANPEDLPRIWWCATGSLAFLPIHAAGIYGTEAGDKVSDYVVSSYTPTLTAILDLSEPAVRDNFKILAVAQPSTPYATPIPKTEDEIQQVRMIAGDHLIVSLANEEATVERVVRGMRETDWVHMACHGQQCTGNPMKSGLLLHDKILELSMIVKEALPRAELAFLSACQTATGDEKIADESVHLAAGMFLAGYRGVIATMWSINDNDAPQIAEDVYRRILKGGRPNRKEAAYALHDAVKRLRDSGANFMSWVPFIHIGR